MKNAAGSSFRRRRGSTAMGVVLEYLSLIDIRLSGNTSSLLCLCGISVSLAFYVLYLKFYPRSYHSVILRRVIRRLIQERSQRQTNSISILSSSNRRRQRTIQQAPTTSFSVCNENYNNDDNNNNDDNRTIKISDDDTGLSSIGSIDDSSKQDGVIFRQFHQASSAVLPSSSSATPAAAATSSSAADQQRMRRRITRRRRTLSESPPDVISRLDDFICLIPEIRIDRSRHVDQPISRTRNVLDWLAQIDFDPSRTSFFDEDPLDNAEDAAARRALMQGMQSLESIASAGSGSSNCGCVYRSRDNWCQDCLLDSGESVGGGGGRSGRRWDSTAMQVQVEDQGQGPSVLCPRRTSTSSATLDVAFRRSRDDCSTDHSFVAPVPALGGGAEECDGPELTTVRVSDEGLDAPKKKVFYFEEEEDDDFDSTSEKGDLPHQVHFAASSSGQKYLPDSQLKQARPLGHTESPLTDGPPHSGGVAGYDLLRMRIFGVDRKRRISTGSGLSPKFLASRGLLRNHHSFTSAISGTSSEYTYRESLVSKGFSIDCGEDLTDFVIQGEDLLEAAEFSRYTLTNIDQLHEELEFIQRNITYINNKVEFLQTRDDLPSFAARYGYGIEESIGNDLCGIMETAGAFEPGIRPRQRSRSLCLMPGDATTTTTTTTAVDNTQVPTFKDIDDDLHPGLTTDGFVWDYGSDLALNPTFTHHRSLNGLAAGETGEDDVSNQLRTRRSRSDEMEYFSLRRGNLSTDDLCAVKSDDDDDDDDVIDDDPDMTYAAQIPARQHTESTCDEYFDDDYDMLTHLHR